MTKNRTTNYLAAACVVAVIAAVASAQGLQTRTVDANERVPISATIVTDADTRLEVITLEPLPLTAAPAALERYGIKRLELYLKMARVNDPRMTSIQYETICVRAVGNPTISIKAIEIAQRNDGRQWGILSDNNTIDEYDERGIPIGRRLCQTDQTIGQIGGLRQFISMADELVITIGPIRAVLPSVELDRARKFLLTLPQR